MVRAASTAYRRIRVLGAGKGAAPMAAALENLLGDRISDGLVIVKYGHDLPEGQRDQTHQDQGRRTPGPR